MGHTSTGVIFKPIDIKGDIAAVLGRSSVGGLGLLCSDKDASNVDQGAINSKSLRKPICVNKKEELTDAEWKINNYGYTIPSYYGNAGLVSTVDGLIKKHNAGNIWTYQKPRGAANNEWFRATDFDGYEGNATALPFTVDYPDQPEVGGSSRIGITYLYDFLQWGLFSSYSPTFANLYLGLLCWPASSQAPTTCYLLPVTSSTTEQTILDIASNETFSYTLPSNVFSSGVSYKLQPVIMTYDAGANYGNWIPVSQNSTPTLSGYFYDIDCPQIQITPRAQATPDSLVYVTPDGEGASVTGDYPRTLSSIDVTIQNDNNSQINNCVLYIYVMDYTSGPPGRRVEFGHTSAFSLAANSSVTKTITGSLTFMPAGEYGQGQYEFSFKLGSGTTVYTKNTPENEYFRIGER